MKNIDDDIRKALGSQTATPPDLDAMVRRRMDEVIARQAARKSALLKLMLIASVLAGLGFMYLEISLLLPLITLPVFKVGFIWAHTGALALLAFLAIMTGGRNVHNNGYSTLNN